MYCHGSQSVKASASGREKPHNGRILGAYQAKANVAAFWELPPYSLVQHRYMYYLLLYGGGSL